MRALLLSITVVLVAPAAGCSDEILASDYDQSCSIDADCVQVIELEADGSDCSTGCTSVAINKKDQARYDEDLADARSKCGGMRSAFCEISGTPICVKGRCEIRRE